MARGRTRKAPPPPDSTITARQKFVFKVMINIYEPQTAKGQYVEVKFTCEELGVDGCEGRVPACFAHLGEKHFSINLYSKNDGSDHGVIQDARWWTLQFSKLVEITH